ncbi:hypothetical protein ACM66B_007080 [Microbotryomycetes sp. NB124-2]
MRNIVVVGASYVGLGAANELVKLLPQESHRVILLDKHSHFHHLFAFPRFAIVPEHEHKAFIPLSLPAPHLYFGSSSVESISSDAIKLATAVSLDGTETTRIPYDALVIATGTTLSPPGSIPGQATKKEGVEYLRSIQDELKRANKIVILGGGAVGVQMATDLAIQYPNNEKEITIVQSRTLMPRFHNDLHELVMKRFQELGIKTVLGSRAVVPRGGFDGAKRVELQDGRVVEADFVINATGQTPNSGLLKTFAPSAVNEFGYISVKSTFQVDADQCDRVFALGDIADSGAPKAARPGMVQAGIVARNIVSLLGVEPNSTDGSQKPAFEPPTDSIANEPVSAKDVNGNPISLETYKPDPAAIHLTLGFVESVVFRNPPKDPKTGEYAGEPFVWNRDDGKKDMGIEGVWARRAGKQPQSDEGYWE